MLLHGKIYLYQFIKILNNGKTPEEAIEPFEL